MEIALDKIYTFADYLTWFDDTRRELIDGFVKLFPAPNYQHADVSKNIVKSFINSDIEKKSNLRVYYAPVDVVLSDDKNVKELKDTEIKTVVQPDIFICTVDQLFKGRCYGAPILIIEILSKSNKKHEWVTKFFLYERNKVQEYWIVDTAAKSINVFHYEDDKFSNGEEYEIDEEFKIKCLGDFPVKVSDVFKF